jgi:hypothetical protein
MTGLGSIFPFLSLLPTSVSRARGPNASELGPALRTVEGALWGGLESQSTVSYDKASGRYVWIRIKIPDPVTFPQSQF